MANGAKKAAGTAEKQNNLLQTLLIALLVLMVLGLFLRFFSSSPVIKRAMELIGLRQAEPARTSFIYPSGAGEKFELCGSRLAVVSSAGFQLLEEDGSAVAAESLAMDRPAITSDASLCAFYDVGSTEMRIIGNDGHIAPLQFQERILFADLSHDGYLTVVTEYPDYKGRVSVYNAGLSPLFTLDCDASGYPLNARVSPGRRLVVSCVSSAGSSLRFFDLYQETERGSFHLENELILDFDFMEDGTVAAITEDELLLLNSEGTLLARVDYTDQKLADYCLTGGCAALLLYDNRSGYEGRLVTIKSDGSVIEELEISRAVNGLSVSGEYLLVQYADEVTLYTADFRDDISCQRVENVRRALLREDLTALLLGSYGADIIHFS
ncbi:MAG: hypothetical protein E7442_03085 [Ruminococcaceae bacterium]|nr:hypothetical protein [Oscillospiraceae bacterium]